MKEVRKQIKNEIGNENGGSESDSEAERITNKEIKKRGKEFGEVSEKRGVGTGYFSFRQEKPRNIQNLRSVKTKKNQYKNEFIKKEKKITSLGMSPPRFSFFQPDQEEEIFNTIKNKRDIYTVENKRKNFLLAKLRIMGETFIEEGVNSTIEKKEEKSSLDAGRVEEKKRQENKSFSGNSYGKKV